MIDLSKTADDHDFRESSASRGINLGIEGSVVVHNSVTSVDKPPPCTTDSSSSGGTIVNLVNDSEEECSADGAVVLPTEEECSADGAVVLPTFRKDYEKRMYDTLKVLYTEAFKLPYKEVQVGGRLVQLDSFHYVDSSNACQPEYNNKRAKKFELIARGEQVFIYRWEIKACLLAYLRMVRIKMHSSLFA